MRTEKHVFHKKLFTYGLDFLKKVKIVPKMKTSYASPPEMVDSLNAFILAEIRVITEEISEQEEFFVGTSHKIVQDGLAFLMSVAVGFHKQDFILQQKHKKVILVGNSCHFLLRVQIWPPLISTCFVLSNNFCIEQSIQAMMKWRAR